MERMEANRNENNKHITIIDAIMGSGKSTYIIKEINKHPEKRYLVVLPTLDECKRYSEKIEVSTYQPQTKSTKSQDLQRLIERNQNVVTTHALIQQVDETIMQLLKQRNYTLVIDECLDVLHRYEKQFTSDDLRSILNDGYVIVDKSGYLVWNDSKEETMFSHEYQGRWSDIKRLCKLQSLMCLPTKEQTLVTSIVMWVFPVEFFSCFQHCYIATYLWNGSIQKNYFDLHHLSYEHKSLTSKGEELELIDYDPMLERALRRKYFDLITVCDKDSLNWIGKSKKGKENPLSSAWYKRKKNDGSTLLMELKKNVSNYFRNHLKAKSADCMWTVFKNVKGHIRGQGYSKGFVPFNMKATNDYRHKSALAYCVNIFLHVDVVRFFRAHGINPNENLYAVSEMLQWIWRSRIRDGQPISLYLPSERMRRLLFSWAGRKIDGV